MPVIAAIWGHCLGGGLQIALGADLRIVHPDASLSVLEIRWGLVARHDRNRHPAPTGRTGRRQGAGLDRRAVSGEEAAGIGLATRPATPRWKRPWRSPRDRRQEPARDPWHQAPRRAVGSRAARPAVRRRAGEVIGSLVSTPNQVEAVAAFFEKRDPSFADPG